MRRFVISTTAQLPNLHEEGNVSTGNIALPTMDRGALLA